MAAAGRAGDSPASISDLQQQVLLATASGDGPHRIYIMSGDENGGGEIKAGQQRILGDQAVWAVRALALGGYVEVEKDDCFRLTPAGSQAVRRIGSNA